MIATLLTPYRGRDDFRIDDLVHLAADVVPQVAGPQLRYKVTSIPDSRTVRYYIHEGLVDPPHGAAGPAALYGYRHLLQLVLVKVLQAHYLPIRQIRQTIEKLTDRELEKLLDSWRSKTASSPPSNPVVVAAVSGDTLRQEVKPAFAAPAASAEALLRSFYSSPDATDSPLAAEASRHESAGWTRHELYPGIELRVHDGAVIPPGSSFSSALSSRLRVILEKTAVDRRRKT